MMLRQYFLGCLAQASYLIGDERTGTAAVVDPRRDVAEYLDDAADAGLRITHVILTHFHADFVAGHLELRRRTGARIYLGAGADAEFDFTPLRDFDVLEFGDVRLSILETPGHTPEGISIVVYDLVRSDRVPHAVLTGDTLFIGDVGRPDLMASVGLSAETLAGMLYDSLYQKLLRLPDGTVLYPGHGAGSLCGKNLGPDRVSTIGEQRRTNYALQAMSKDAFVDLVSNDQPPMPAYFARDARLNRCERPTLDEALARELTPLTLDAVLRAQAEGAQLLDTRNPVDFAAGHLPGSLNIGLAGRFASWAGTLLTPDRPIVVVASRGLEETSMTRLGRVGLDNVLGYLDGGVEALGAHAELVRHPIRIMSDELRARLGTLPVIDVRAEAEAVNGAIPGSINIPLEQLRAHLDTIPVEGPIVVYCRTGERSSIAASVLEQAGRRDVFDLVGGITAWIASDRRGATVHG